ncbi:hypothetical protein D3C72_1687390 [compost metagenome]
MRLLQKTDNPVCIPHSCMLRRSDYNRLVGTRDGVAEAMLDPCRTINQDVFILLLELENDILHLLRGHGGLVFGLSRRQHIQLIKTFVLDQCLIQPAAPLRHINEIINDPVFQAHNYIQIPQSDIRINQTYFFALQCKCGTNIGCCGRFANSAFTRGYDNCFSHGGYTPLNTFKP